MYILYINTAVEALKNRPLQCAHVPSIIIITDAIPGNNDEVYAPIDTSSDKLEPVAPAYVAVIWYALKAADCNAPAPRRAMTRPEWRISPF